MINLIGNILGLVFSNKYSSAMFSMFLVFYGSKAAPNLLEINDFFKYFLFRVFILSMIVYKFDGLKDFKSSKKVTYSILIALIFSSIFEICNKTLLKKKTINEKFTEEADEYPQCSNKPEPGKFVHYVLKNEDKSCFYFYQIEKFPPELCRGTFDGVKFCVNSPNENIEITGCSKNIPNVDKCLYWYNHKMRTE